MTATVGITREEKRQSLMALRLQWVDCTRCDLCTHRKQIVFADGAPNGKVLIVGEAPGKEEDLKGTPFVGPCGKVLEEILLALGVNLAEEVHITNTCLCRPPENRRPYAPEIEACRPRLLEQIRLVDPDLIVALGNIAGNALLRRKVAVTKERGQIFDTVFEGAEGPYIIPVILTYHPSAILRDPDRERGGLLQLMVEDIRLAFRLVDQARKLWYGERLPKRKAKINVQL